MPVKKRPALLRLKDVQRVLNCSLPMIYKLLYNGELKGIRLGIRGIRITEISLNAFLEENVILPLDVKDHFS